MVAQLPIPTTKVPVRDNLGRKTLRSRIVGIIKNTSVLPSRQLMPGILEFDAAWPVVKVSHLI